jgi:hypothetical protein
MLRKSGQEVRLITCTREVPDSNLSLGPEYFEVFRDISWCLQESVGV